MKAKCDLEKYTLFLVSEPFRADCTKLARSLNEMSHDSVNAFLLRENFSSKDLFDSVKNEINLEGGILSVDETIIDKPFSDINKNYFVQYFYSGKHHKAVKGISLTTLYYSDLKGNKLPISFRVYDPEDGKTKNDYFQEMVEEVMDWGLKPLMATGDSVFSSKKNLKFLRKKEIGFCFGIESNRVISNEVHVYTQVKDTEIPEEGLVTHLKEVGFAKIFKKAYKEQGFRYYAYWLPEESDYKEAGKEDFEKVHKIHWSIEVFHRALKQLVNLEKFMIRTGQGVLNHIFCSLNAYCWLKRKQAKGEIQNIYELKESLFRPIVGNFITSNINS